MIKKNKLILYFSIVNLIVLLLINVISYFIHIENYVCLFITKTVLLGFSIPSILILASEYSKSVKKLIHINEYSSRLNEVIICQSQNRLYYQGNIVKTAKTLTKQIADVMSIDRCSLWLYNQDKTKILCQQLYIKNERKWHTGFELNRQDYPQYFEYLDVEPIIIATDAYKHKATSCFDKTYLDYYGIKSMLDVPIIYKGEIIGVICIENCTPKDWLILEVNFVRIISSLYSFAHSIKEIIKLQGNYDEFENFVDNSVLVSKADKNGNITYVNKKFEDVSGWKLDDVIGKNHSIVNSGRHPKEFWKQMYNTVVIEKRIWNDIVINRTKKGDLYWVDSYIKADFDEKGDLLGFRSLRYDVTKVMKQNIEIGKKNVYLEHAAKILRHDMHSGINTYIPRGISSLERRLSADKMEELKISAPFRMIKEGLIHTQKVYKGVYEFTNLVKKDAILNVEECDLKEILDNYLTSTSYKSQVKIHPLCIKKVNESLFCTAIDNLIRNGLKYNDSNTKLVEIQMESKNVLAIQDNGRGLTQEEFLAYSQPYSRKKNQKESGTGLGLNICIAILNEHRFEVSCEKNKIGTKIKINFKKSKND